MPARVGGRALHFSISVTKMQTLLLTKGVKNTCHFL